MQALLSVLTFEFAVPASATGEAAPSDYDLSMILYRDVGVSCCMALCVFGQEALTLRTRSSAE
jgi:hypothetical protein